PSTVTGPRGGVPPEVRLRRPSRRARRSAQLRPARPWASPEARAGGVRPQHRRHAAESGPKAYGRSYTSRHPATWVIRRVHMPFGHDMAHSLTTVVELINTCPAVDGKEGLADLDALREFVTRRQVSGVESLTDEDLAEV